MSRSLERHPELDLMPGTMQPGSAQEDWLMLAAQPAARSAPVETPHDLVLRLAAADPRIVVVSLLGGEVSARLAEKLPAQIYESDPHDPAVLEWCYSLASSGSKPVVLLDQAALARLQKNLADEIAAHPLALTLLVDAREAGDGHAASPPEVTAITAAASNGAAAAPAGEEANLLARLAGVSLLAPWNLAELEEMLRAVLSREDSAILWLPTGAPAGMPQLAPRAAPVWGKSQKIGAGEDLALLALGEGVAAACQAAKLLADEGIAATVVNLRFLRPLDEETLLEVARRARAAVLLEVNPALGLSSDVANLLSSHGVARSLSVLSSPAGLRPCKAYEPDHPYVRQVVEDCRALLEESSRRAALMLAREPIAPVCVADIRDLTDFRPSSEQVRQELDAVLAIELSPTAQQWVDAYEKLGRRSLYLWKWCQQGIELTILPCVPAEYRAHVNDTKLLGVMLDVLLDDVADFERDSILLERLIGLLHDQTDLSEFDPRQLAYAEFTKQVWEAIKRRAQEYPQYAAYQDLFRYDYLQLFNTMRYSNLVNGRLALLNLVEHDLYLPHNMHMIIFSTLDLMCTPHVNPRELGHVREAMWHAQCMGQIGNQITTWQRELDEGDYTSGVFARAITMGDLTVDQLVDGNREQIRAAIQHGRHEEHFFQQWKDHRRRLLDLTRRITAFDVPALVGGLDRLMQIELGSWGQR